MVIAIVLLEIGMELNVVIVGVVADRDGAFAAENVFDEEFKSVVRTQGVNFVNHNVGG